MAIKKELASVVEKAPPITPKILLAKAVHVNWNSSEDKTIYAALVIGFTLFLRKSNLVLESTTTFNKKEQITVENVWYKGGMMLLDIKWSKTLQTRDRELMLPIVPEKNNILCAVYWIKEILRSRRHLKVGDPLLAFQVGGQLIPLTYEKLSKKLKEWVSATGRQGENFSLHGLRRGGQSSPHHGYLQRGHPTHGRLEVQRLYGVHRFNA